MIDTAQIISGTNAAASVADSAHGFNNVSASGVTQKYRTRNPLVFATMHNPLSVEH